MTINVLDSSGRCMGELRLSAELLVKGIGADQLAVTDSGGTLLATIAIRPGYHSADLAQLTERVASSAKARAWPEVVPDLAVVSLNADQRQALADLVDTERKHASRWWAVLNEMRARRELPSWVFERFVGSAADHERWLDDCAETNAALFGRRRYIHSDGEPEMVEVYAGDVLYEATRRQAPVGGAGGVELVEQMQEAVRQHLSGEITLVSTNERKPS